MTSTSATSGIGTPETAPGLPAMAEAATES
jgi:hypothetical protein